MEINERQRNRSDLKSYFVKNAIPTENQFADLVDSLLNQRDDGIVKSGGDPLSIEASGDDTSQKKAINFYLNFTDAKPSWVVSLKPRSDPKKPATGRLGFSIGDGDGNSRLCIEGKTGRVGIGTTAPTQQLDVAGPMVCRGLSLARANTDRRALFLAMVGDFNHALYNNLSNADGEGAWDGSKWNTFAGLDIRVGAGSTKVSALKILQNGNVGVGTAAPKQRLEVAGNLVVTGSIDTGGVNIQRSVPAHLDVDGSFYRFKGQAYITVDDNLYIRDTKGAIRMHFQTNSGVFKTDVLRLGDKFRFSAIGDKHGNDTWLRMFDVRNRGYHGGFAAGKLWTQEKKLAGSDRRLKKNIRRIAGALDKVNKLRGVGFEWKKRLSNERAYIGLIAQEVEAVVPEVVEEGPGQVKGIDYDGLVALLVEAVKDQQAHIEGLSRQLGQLREQLGLETPGIADPVG